MASGDTLNIRYWNGTTLYSQLVTLSSSAAKGATSISVSSFTPSVAYPIGTELIPISVTLAISDTPFVSPVTLITNVVGGGGGGAAGGNQTNGPGGGGAGGMWVEQAIPVGSATTMKVTLGVFGAGSPSGTGLSAGKNGGVSTLVLNGYTVTAAHGEGGYGSYQGGAPGSLTPSTYSSSQNGNGSWAAWLAGISATASPLQYQPGVGGGQGPSASGTWNSAGLNGLGLMGGGGGQGFAATTTNKGLAGSPGSYTQGGAAGVTGTGTGTGGNATNASPNTGSGGAGGGSGTGTNAGGYGGAGGSGYIILTQVA